MEVMPVPKGHLPYTGQGLTPARDPDVTPAAQGLSTQVSVWLNEQVGSFDASRFCTPWKVMRNGNPFETWGGGDVETPMSFLIGKALKERRVGRAVRDASRKL